MKRKVLLILCIAAISAMFVQSCEVNGCSKGTLISGVNNHESQKMKGNCMECHGPNGNGKGCFMIAGTVYDSLELNTNANAVIMLYTQPNGGGQLVATLDVDQSGNFYTTAIVNFGNGLYPAIVSKKDNSTQFMATPTVIGACGSCHGVLNAKIWIN